MSANRAAAPPAVPPAVLQPPPPPAFAAESGMRARLFRNVEAEAPGLVAVINASRAAAGIETRDSVASLTNDYRHLPHGDPSSDCLILERAGRTVGYTRADFSDDTEGGLAYEMAFAADPAGCDVEAVRTLLRWGLARCRQIAAGHDDHRPRYFGAWCHDSETWLATALGAEGFAPIRRFHDMVRPDLEGVTVSPLPAGIEMRPVRPRDWRAIWEADVEAFRDHWGDLDDSEASYERFVHEPVQRPELWQVGWDGDQVAGQVIVAIDESENEALGLRRGWLDSVAVRRSWRRRGLASALIGRALIALREAGYTSAALGVDSENRQEALGLYQRSGFNVAATSTAYRRPFD